MCVICRKSYHTVANMKRHMRKIHQASLDGGGISYKIQKQSEKVENIIGAEDLGIEFDLTDNPVEEGDE